MSDPVRVNTLRHTAGIVSAHLSHNKLETELLPQLIQSVYQALSGLDSELEASNARREPAVPIRKSVFPDYIVCLEDGRKLKMIKRYLRTHFDLTPAAYRERWGLPADYPMVAPSYAKIRSGLAHRHGLGRKSAVEQPAGEASEFEQEAAASKPAKASTRRKAAAVEVE